MKNANDHQYHIVPFHFIGVVREFPTAPTDSFLIANKDYISKMTGSDTAESVLMCATGKSEELAAQARNVLGSLDAKVTDINLVRKSNLYGIYKVFLRFIHAS